MKARNDDNDDDNNIRKDFGEKQQKHRPTTHKPRGRKRRRSRDSCRDPKKNKTSEEAIIAKPPSAAENSLRQPLNGKILAISTLSSAAEASRHTEVVKQKEESATTYKSVVALCKKAGAAITGQVHRRVHCVIVTESAIVGETQRIRKAWKKRIPGMYTEIISRMYQCMVDGWFI